MRRKLLIGLLMLALPSAALALPPCYIQVNSYTIYETYDFGDTCTVVVWYLDDNGTYYDSGVVMTGACESPCSA